MTTIFQFQPTPQAPYQFMPTLDGQQYNVIVTWNLFGQRWYITIYDLSGNVVLSEPLGASPSALNIAMLSWANGWITATTEVPHGYLMDQTVNLTVTGCLPDSYNDGVQAIVVDDITLEWPMVSDPGTATQFGFVSWAIDLVEGLFQTSTMVFRDGTQQFEVSP